MRSKGTFEKKISATKRIYFPQKEWTLWWFFYQAMDTKNKNTRPYLKKSMLGHIFLYMPIVNFHCTLVSNAKQN